MLGIIHRALLELGPDHFRKYFKLASKKSPVARCHTRQIMTHRQGKFLDLLAFSRLAAADIYNLLPQYMVDAKTTKDFQHRLQELVNVAAQTGIHEWQDVFSPRAPLHNHALRKWFGWIGKTTYRQIDDSIKTVQTGCVTAWIRFATNGNNEE